MTGGGACDPLPSNERCGWDEDAERELLAFLDGLDRRGIRFALSNVLSSHERENRILTDWLEGSPGKYRAHHLSHSYQNSSYHTKARLSESDEVLIVNYQA